MSRAKSLLSVDGSEDLRRVTAVAAVLFGVITVFRFALSDPLHGIGFMYVVPISLVAATLGWRPGLIAAVVAVGLTAIWALTDDVPLGFAAYLSRTLAFVSIAVLVGLQHRERLIVEEDRKVLLAQLQAAALLDSLTQLPNRRAWSQRIEHETRRAARTGEPLSVATIDLDGLKQTNDSEGHDAGDRLIIAATQSWLPGLRDSDFLARMGGDEFAWAMPACPQANAEAVARRMIDGSSGSCSIGIATWNGTESSAELLARSDRAMYEAKTSGGGRIAIDRG